MRATDRVRLVFIGDVAEPGGIYILIRIFLHRFHSYKFFEISDAFQRQVLLNDWEILSPAPRIVYRTHDDGS